MIGVTMVMPAGVVEPAGAQPQDLVVTILGNELLHRLPGTAAWSGGSASKLRTRSCPSRTTGGTPCPEGAGEPVIVVAPSPRWRRP